MLIYCQIIIYIFYKICMFVIDSEDFADSPMQNVKNCRNSKTGILLSGCDWTRTADTVWFG